jgi:hypothetical protein
MKIMKPFRAAGRIRPVIAPRHEEKIWEKIAPAIEERKGGGTLKRIAPRNVRAVFMQMAPQEIRYTRWDFDRTANRKKIIEKIVHILHRVE